MRTNLMLNDDLVQEAFNQSGARTKKALIFLALKGQIYFAKDYDHKKPRER